MVLHYYDSPPANLLPNEMVCSVLSCGSQHYILPTFRTVQSKIKHQTVTINNYTWILIASVIVTFTLLSENC